MTQVTQPFPTHQCKLNSAIEFDYHDGWQTALTAAHLLDLCARVLHNSMAFKEDQLNKQAMKQAKPTLC